jgi:hypothetical protein
MAVNCCRYAEGVYADLAGDFLNMENIKILEGDKRGQEVVCLSAQASFSASRSMSMAAIRGVGAQHKTALVRVFRAELG